MNNVNASQVQRTNDVSIVSKCSTARKNYFRDDFIEEFVEKQEAKLRVRSSLIHLGYYTRAEILTKLIIDYIKFLELQKVLKIVSCGCGFDTIFWRLSESHVLKNQSLLIEVDFPVVIQKKILLINQSEKLRSYLSECIDSQLSSKVHKLSNNYYLLEADLSNLSLFEELLRTVDVNFEIPTLFLSECALTYMKDSDTLIKWMAEKFKNSCFINYEQIYPFDAFGQVMINHFKKLQSLLFSVLKYPDCMSHIFRYKNLGFENSFAMSEWDALTWLTTEKEREKAFSLEVFDEFEEFHLKCTHYVVAFGGNGISSTWIDSFPPYVLNRKYEIDSRPVLHCQIIQNDLELIRHCCCKVKENTFVFGGCNRQNRSSEVCKYTTGTLENLKLDSTNVKLDLVYGTVTYFEIKEVPFVCLYGGRTSPDKIWNNGIPVVFELVNGDKFIYRPMISEGNPVPRYRTAVILLNSDETKAEFLMFGGRTSDVKVLSDLWHFTISYCDNENLSCKWRKFERTNLWPCARMSHSLIACPDTSAVYLVGGLKADLSIVLNDIWKWCCKNESWQKIELTKGLLPRYGHTSHIRNSIIYLVGGVNTLGDLQPVLATVSLTNLTVTEYKSPALSPSPLLFNHTSVIVNSDLCILEVIGGGGHCFSFGTSFNKRPMRLRIDE